MVPPPAIALPPVPFQHVLATSFLAPPPPTPGLRSRSHSQGNKRKRLNEDVSDNRNDANTSKSRNFKKSVIGTSDSTKTGRKMKSPPTDIFIWGVHWDTNVDDIVNDLSSSGINIETKDVQLKSKEDAKLRSYKISVPAADLDKALDPGIWPLRVKVREWVYYGNKNKKRDSDSKSRDADRADAPAVPGSETEAQNS